MNLKNNGNGETQELGKNVMIEYKFPPSKADTFVIGVLVYTQKKAKSKVGQFSVHLMIYFSIKAPRYSVPIQPQSLKMVLHPGFPILSRIGVASLGTGCTVRFLQSFKDQR